MRILVAEDEKHLNRMRKRYHQKRDAVIACIRGGPLAERARITEEDAGLHFLMTLDTTLPDAVPAPGSRSPPAFFAGRCGSVRHA